MFKKINKKGFTLAELLIVVAIIGVLVAISIPIFTAQLRKARLATNQANARSGYAALTAQILQDGLASGAGTYTVSTGQITMTSSSVDTVDASAAPQTWGVDDNIGIVLGNETAKTWTITIDKNGNVKYVGSAT